MNTKHTKEREVTRTGPTYILLLKFTQKGSETIKNLAQRMEKVRNMWKSIGVEAKANYFTFGRYDAIGTVEASSDEAMAKAALSIGSGGTVSVETLKALPEAEGFEIIRGLP